MAHQLDFHMTLWSDDNKLLLHLERALQSMASIKVRSEVEPGVGVTEPSLRLNALVQLLLTCEQHARWNKLNQVDIHSIDINWDDDTDEEDPLEQQDRLKLPRFDDSYNVGDRMRLWHDPRYYHQSEGEADDTTTG